MPKTRGQKLVELRRPQISFNEAEPIVSMLTFKDTVWVATTKRVFRLVGEQLHPVEFVLLPDAEPDDQNGWTDA